MDEMKEETVFFFTDCSMFMYKQTIIAVETVSWTSSLFKHCIFLKRKTCTAIYMGCMVFLMRSDQ